MKIDKSLVKKSFSEAAETYDSNSLLQKEVVEELVNWVSSLEERYACSVSMPSGMARAALRSSGNLTLDIGCGTGRLMDSIKGLYPCSSLYGCDIALPMLFKARDRMEEKARLAASDCEEIPFRDSSFDTVVSSLTYQWAQDIHLAFKEAARVLKPGGLFILSTLGPKTLHELRVCYGESYSAAGLMDFIDKESISSALKTAGLEVEAIEERPVIKRYGSLLELARVLKNIGASPQASNGGKGLSRGMMLRKAGKLYMEKFPSPDGGIIATYDVIFAAARKA